ncbi:hypothetical protein LRY60_03095 [Candidatus Woesebacteria bacterium]|nr:hypothetical protein [Candidatus Woesebacteria bacterium]
MPQSQRYSLEHLQIQTEDGIVLPGLWYTPTQKDSQTACIFLHGCGNASIFYKVDKMHLFAERLAEQGIHFSRLITAVPPMCANSPESLREKSRK